MEYKGSMYFIHVESEGQTLFYENEELAILSLSGADFPEMELFTSPKGFGHGAYVTGMRKLPREIEITFVIRSFDRFKYGKIRDKLIAFHNPEKTYKVYISYAGRTRYLEKCRIKAVKYPTERYGVNPTFSIIFLSEDSDFRQTNYINRTLRSETPLWHNVRIYKTVKGRLTNHGRLYFSGVVNENKTEFTHGGNAAAPFDIVIDFSGTVNGVQVKLNEVSYKTNRTFEAGETLLISSLFNHVSVKDKSGETYDLPSKAENGKQAEDFIVKIGLNTLEVTSLDKMNEKNMKYKVRYEGVYDGV